MSAAQGAPRLSGEFESRFYRPPGQLRCTVSQTQTPALDPCLQASPSSEWPSQSTKFQGFLFFFAMPHQRGLLTQLYTYEVPALPCVRQARAIGSCRRPRPHRSTPCPERPSVNTEGKRIQSFRVAPNDWAYREVTHKPRASTVDGCDKPGAQGHTAVLNLTAWTRHDHRLLAAWRRSSWPGL